MDNTCLKKEDNFEAKEINYYIYQDLVRIEDTDYKHRGIKFYNLNDGSFYFEIKDVNNVVAIIQDGLDFFVQYKNGTIIPHLSKDWYSASRIMPYSRKIDLLKEAFKSGESKPTLKDNQHIRAITKYKISCRYLIEKRKGGYMLFNVADQLVSFLDIYKRMASFPTIKRKKLVLFEKQEDSDTKYGLYNVIDNCEYILDEETYKSLRSRKPDVFLITLVKQELEQYFNTGITQDFRIIKGINVLPTKAFYSSKDLKRGRIRKPLIHEIISPEELGKKRKEEREKNKEAGIKSQTKNALYLLNNPPREVPDYEPEYIDGYEELIGGIRVIKKEKKEKPLRLMKRKALEESKFIYDAPARDIKIDIEKDQYYFLYDISKYLVINEPIEVEEEKKTVTVDDDFDPNDPLYRQSLAYKAKNINKRPSYLKTSVWLFSDFEWNEAFKAYIPRPNTKPIFEVYHCEGLIQYGPAHFYVQSRGTQYRINDYTSEYIYYLNCPIPELSDIFKNKKPGDLTSEMRRNYYLKNADSNRKYLMTMPGCIVDMNLNFPGSSHLTDISKLIINTRYVLIGDRGLYDMVDYRYIDYSRIYRSVTYKKGSFNDEHPVLYAEMISDKGLSSFIEIDGVTGEILNDNELSPEEIDNEISLTDQMKLKNKPKQ